MGLTVNIHGCDGSFWPVHGEDAGSEGVWLGYDQVKGLHDARTRTAWKEGARQNGGSMKGMWFEIRDLNLGFEIVASRVPGGDQADIDSRFRQAFDYREDLWDHDAKLARVEVIEDSSTRNLDVQLYEQPDFDPPADPLVIGHANPKLPLRAGHPFWYEPDEITHWFTEVDGPGEIEVENPTDLPMYQKWICTIADWVLPDVSWEGPPGDRHPGVSKLTGRDDSERSIIMPHLTAINGGATVDLDPMKLMVRDKHDMNLLGQMPVPGMFFEYVIPPYTQRQTLPVSVTNVPAEGAMVQLVQPRNWTRPYGLQKW